MDPLSITCAILTIIGAGAGVTKTIRKLALLKDAPLSLMQLNNEVSDLSMAVCSIDNLYKDGRQLSLSPAARSYITTALVEAKDAAKDLETLIQSRLSKVKTTRLDRLHWMMVESTIIQMKERVRSAKLSLIAATNVLTWATTSSLELRIQQLESTTVAYLSQIAMANDNQDKTLQLKSADMDEQGNCIPSSPAGISNLMRSFSESSSVMVCDDTSPTMVYNKEVIEVLVSPKGKCSSACTCACHYKHNARTPQLFDRALGSLFIGYRSNLQGSATCDLKECVEHSKKLSISSVTYMFPSWWMWRFAISIKTTPGYQLRLLRVRPKTDPIFKALSALKLLTVRKMLQDGEASVLDINEDGQSLLTSLQSTEIVKMLIDAGSDIQQDDQNAMTPYTYVWTGFLRHGDHRYFTKDLLNMFGSNADLESLGLTDLHAAILGLGNAAISDALLATTRANVDKQDLIGMTALAWATTRSNINVMRQLLSKGADPNLPDNQGRITLHHWVKGGNHDCLRILLDAGAEPDRADKFGETPFLRAMYFFKAVEVRGLELLIQRGADQQRKSLEGWTAIHLTVRWNHTDTARLDCLLRHGLDINQMDEDGMSPLMIAIMHNIPKSVEDLILRGASHLGCMRGGRSLLHIIAAFADLPTLQVFSRYQDFINSLDFNVLDDAGQTPLEIAKARVARRSDASDGLEKYDSKLLDWYESFLLLLNQPPEIFFDTTG